MHSEDITILKEQSTFMDTYRFFDFDFSIRSDSERVLGVFMDIFGRFHTNRHGTELAYYILNKGSSFGLCAVIVDDRMYTVEEPDDLIGYAYMKIMDSALSRVLSHYLFHAAALSFNDKGIILPATSRSGKTTLTLELIKRGFNFLSDDVAAISKSDRLLYPFPKGIGMLPSTLELYPEAELDSLGSLPMIGGGEKKLLDIGAIYPGRIGGACQVKYLVFLGFEPEIKREIKGDEYLYIVINRITEELLSDIRSAEGVKDVSIYPYKKYPIIKLLLNGKGPVLSHVEEVCQRHQVLIFDSSNGKEKKVDFSGIPKLERIPKSIASIELLKRLKGVALLRDKHKSKITELIMNLGRFLEGVECFYLTPGRLKESADKICELTS